MAFSLVIHVALSLFMHALDDWTACCFGIKTTNGCNLFGFAESI